MIENGVKLIERTDILVELKGTYEIVELRLCVD